MPRRILVTGAAGFLGGAVVRRLADRADVERIVAVDLDVDEAAAAPSVRPVRHDVRDSMAPLLREHRIDAVVHSAFAVRPPRDRQAARRTNVDATRQLIDDAHRLSVERLVYPSSTTVYGARQGTSFHREDETPQPLPGFTYSEHKVEAERILLGGPVPTSILRGCIVVGPGADSFILSSLGLPLIPHPTGANPPMQFLFIDDYVSAVEAALMSSSIGVFNIAGSGTIRLRELVAALGTRSVPIPEPVLRRIIEISWRLRLQNRSPAAGLALIHHPWLASIDKIRTELGWEPRRSSEEAILTWASTR